MAMLLDKEENNRKAIVNGDISDREKEVSVAIAKGDKNKEIAENLYISVYTAITHRWNIMLKIGDRIDVLCAD